MDRLGLISKIIKEILIKILFQKRGFLVKRLIVNDIHSKLFWRGIILELMNGILQIDELGSIKASLLSGILGDFVLYRRAQVLIV